MTCITYDYIVSDTTASIKMAVKNQKKKIKIKNKTKVYKEN
jgi:hypothetical protein